MAGAVTTACADFSSSAAPASHWTPAPSLTPEKGPQPELPEVGGGGPPSAPDEQGRQKGGKIAPPDGCKDHDPAVIATCLHVVDAVAALPGDGRKPAALAGERKTGKVERVVKGGKPKSWGTLDVDAAGDGGLTDLALSPSFDEDQLVYAYITTATDNRIVRFGEGTEPQPIVTGIPRGTRHNRGVLAVDANGDLLVATGDAGDKGTARKKSSLAGKVLRVDTHAKSSGGHKAAKVLAGGVTDPGGLCVGVGKSKRTWLTDRSAEGDVVRTVSGSTLGPDVWRWKDKPGVAGCVEDSNGVVVAMSRAGNLQSVQVNADGSATGKPGVAFSGKKGYGRLSGLDTVAKGIAVAGTVNRSGGKPVSSDDRVVLLPLQSVSGGAGKD